MAPGGQLLVARSGKVVFERNFGYLNPKKKDSVRWNTIYDVASITKIAASLPLIMRAQERGEIGLGDRFSDWFKQLKGTEIGETSLISALSHNGRLPAWIPFYKETLDANGRPIDSLYSNINSETFSIPVSRSLYLKKDYPKVMFERIARAELESKKYRYSDLPYYLIWWYFSDRYGAFDRQIDQFLYKPMGLTYTSFNPYKVFDLENIAPTEIDDYFRYNELQGYVHDMGAAMLGGVAGHAGLFSNANDMAKLMQLYLQGGEYGKKRYLNSETIRRFNTCYYCHQGNRRGVGFDKPQLEGEGSTCGCVSSKSFGHLGFTGTYVWADPEAELVYVFLSNRTYPDMDNNLLGSSNMRTRIQKAIYDARLD
jgi:CubicO group peptidase (beta-lactamase class C family)